MHISWDQSKIRWTCNGELLSHNRRDYDDHYEISYLKWNTFNKAWETNRGLQYDHLYDVPCLEGKRKLIKRLNQFDVDNLIVKINFEDNSLLVETWVIEPRGVNYIHVQDYLIEY